MSRLDAIRAREASATPGPWEAGTKVEGLYGLNGTTISQSATGGYVAADIAFGGENAAFIAASRTDVPLLLAVVDAARRLNVPIEADAGCWYCRGILRTDGMTWWGHETDCPYDALRAALAPLLEPEP